MQQGLQKLQRYYHLNDSISNSSSSRGRRGSESLGEIWTSSDLGNRAIDHIGLSLVD